MQYLNRLWGFILLVGISLTHSNLNADSLRIITFADLIRLEGRFVCRLGNRNNLMRLHGPDAPRIEIPSPRSGMVKLLPRLPELRSRERRLKKALENQTDPRSIVTAKRSLRFTRKLIRLTRECLALRPPTSEPPPSPPTMPTPTATPTPFVPRSLAQETVATFYGSSFTVTYYVISEGETRSGEAAAITLEPVSTTDPYRASVRVYDPDEELVVLEQQERDTSENSAQLFSPEPSKSLPTEPFALAKSGIYEVRVSGNSNVRVKLRLPDDVGWGISFQNGWNRPFIGAQPTMYTWMPQHPNRSLRLTMKSSGASLGLQFPNQALTPILKPGTSIVDRWELTVPPSTATQGFVQAVTLPASQNWEFLAFGMPFILSRTPEEAEAIGAGLARVKGGSMDGYLISHRFQQTIADLLPSLAGRSGSAASLQALSDGNYPATQPACASPIADEDVLKNLTILSNWAGVLPGARWALGNMDGKPNQDLSPSSPWIGSLATSLYKHQTCSEDFQCANGSACVSGKCAIAFSASLDRWDRFQSMVYQNATSSSFPLYAGRSPRGHLHYALIWAATTPHPCNPYGPLAEGAPLRYPELLYRGVAGALSDLLMLSEDENLLGTNESTSDPYPGFAGFALENTIPAFQIAAPHLLSTMTDLMGGSTLGAHVYGAWKKALERLVLRHYYDYVVSSQNQSAHHLVSFMSFALGVQDTEERSFYEGAARRWAGRFFDTLRPAGYFRESTGICSSYTGITTNMIGHYLGLTRSTPKGADTRAEDILRTVYGFLNHTAGVEPDGGVIAGFNFNHRIGQGFERTQYGGARALADYIPEVGIWSRNQSSQMSSSRASLLSLALGFTAVTNNIPFNSFPAVPERFNHFTLPQSSGLLYPSEEAGSFIHNFGNEYLAVKRPGYFAGVFVGAPAANWSYLSNRNNYRTPTTNAHLNIGGSPVEDLPPESGASVSVYNYNPYLGGGLSLFSSPQFGTGIVGTTWSALAQHGLVAWNNGLRYWADYFSTDYSLDEENSLLTVTGSIESLPLQYSRQYFFADSQIEVVVTMTATQSFTVENLIEVIPVPTCTRSNCAAPSLRNRKLRGASLNIDGAPGTPNGTVVSASSVRVVDSLGKGMAIQLGTAHPLSIQRDGIRFIYYDDELQVGRVELRLPTSWTVGQSYSLAYAIVPIN